MPTKKKIVHKSIHSKRLHDIRSYVSFDYNLNDTLTPYAKRKIKKYYDEIEQLKARPFQVYRPRSPSHLEKAQRASQHDSLLPDIKVAFIPTNGRDKIKVRYTKSGAIQFKGSFVNTTAIEFDMAALIDNPEEEARRAIDRDGGGAYTIQAGKYEMPYGYSKNALPLKIAELAHDKKYSNEDSNHYFGNWMFGVNSHTFDKQTNIDDYLATKQKNKKKLQLDRRNKKRREKRARNK